MEIIHDSDKCLARIFFGFVGTYRVAGMGEPWCAMLDKTFALLKQGKIGAILTLTEDDPFGHDYEVVGFAHHHEPIDDAEAPDMPAMDRALEFIDAQIAKDHGVAVHCLEGRGRTGAVLCAWLAKTEGLNTQNAIARVRTLRPITALSLSQKAFLSSYIR